MSRRTGLLLLGMIAVVGGIIYYLNINPDLAKAPSTPTSAPPSAPAALWTVDVSQIASLTISDAAKQLTFTAAVDAGGVWTISEPKSGPADATAMNAMANTAATLSVTRTLTDIGNLADFGLQSPAFRLQLKKKDGAVLRATIGKKDVTGAAYYVLAEGATNPALVPSASLESLLTLPTTPPFATPTPVVTPGTLPTLPVLATATP